MDPAAQIAALEAQLAETRAALTKAQAEAREAQAQREAAEEVALRLQRDLERLKRQIIGPKSERVADPNQLDLPLAPDAEFEPRSPEPDDDVVGNDSGDQDAPEDTKKTRKKRRKGGRRPIAKMNHLRIEVVPSCVGDRHCPCGCGAEAEVIGEDVSWRLEVKPAEIVRVKVVREKVAFPDHDGPGKSTVITAPAPISFALPKAVCGNALLAQVAIDKYADHLPLYRQEARFQREGLHLPRSTMCDWMMDLSNLLRPIWKHMRRGVLAGTWLRADASSMPVKDETRARGRVHRGHIWAWGNYETVLFSYTPDKTAPTVAGLFPGFEGVVLIDGASDFNLLEKSKNVERAGCWAHARRYFYESLTFDAGLSLRGLGIIRELFMAERVVMDAPVELRIALREELCAPVLKGMRAWVDDLRPQQIPGTPTYTALNYLHNQWERLEVFLRTPEIACHNNDSERDLRRPVKGRANWHYAGSPKGAKAAAIYYSLIGTCLLQGIDPRRYLVEILGRLDEPPSRLTPAAIREEWQALNRMS